VIKYRLYAEPECWEWKETFPELWDTFGCGPGKIGDYFVPDNLFGIDIKIACQIHDWDTRISEEASEEHRLKIARVFKYNMIRIVRATPNQYSWMRSARIWEANFYYGRVVKWGWSAYWEERNTNKQYKLVEAT